jgi:hypothetical protein
MKYVTDFLSNNSAIIISVLALLFTIFSFWWMNWRRGGLFVGAPRSYAAIGSEGIAVLEFPFIFFNNGPIPIFIQNLQVIILNGENPRPFVFTATVNKLGKDEGRSMATQFPVRGREAILLICEFQRRPGNIHYEVGSYTVELQAILNKGYKWIRICQFPLHVSSSSVQLINQQFVVHDNVLE